MQAGGCQPTEGLEAVAKLAEMVQTTTAAVAKMGNGNPAIEQVLQTFAKVATEVNAALAGMGIT
eukprot:12891809-Prorocentrum_lima.AAC.1